MISPEAGAALSGSHETDLDSLILSRPAFPVVVSGLSGVGKTSIVQAALALRPDWRASISTTTRPARKTETSGQSYDFVGGEEFRRLKAEGSFLETAEVHGFFYGTPRARLERWLSDGRIVVLNLDVQGGNSLRASFSDGVFVFILPPSILVLEERLKHRDADPPEVMERRLINAREELAQAPRYSYIIVNESLELATRQLISIVEAEQCRVERRMK